MPIKKKKKKEKKKINWLDVTIYGWEHLKKIILIYTLWPNYF